MRYPVQQLPPGAESVGNLAGHWLAVNFKDLHRTMAGVIESGANWYLPLQQKQYECRHDYASPFYPGYLFIVGNRETVGLQVRESVAWFGGEIRSTLVPASQTAFRAYLIATEVYLKSHPSEDIGWTVGTMLEARSGPFEGKQVKLAKQIKGKIAVVELETLGRIVETEIEVGCLGRVA